MTDKALETAMARRKHAIEQLKAVTEEINDLVTQHERLRANLEEIDKFIQMWHNMAGILPPQSAEQRVASVVGETGKRIRPKNPPREDVAAACVNYIREAGRPLMRAELLDQLTKDGIVIRGKDPAMVLSTMLWRSKDVIRRLPEGGYWLAGQRSPTETEFDDLLTNVPMDL